MKVINYELRIEIDGQRVDEMAARGPGAGVGLRKWEQQIRNMNISCGNTNAKVVLFEEVK